MRTWLLISVLLAQLPIPRIDTGTVTGAVRFADGRPAENVRVAAMVVPEADLGNASTLAVISLTDAAGRYRLDSVPVGRYYIVAGRIDAPTFYPAAGDVAGARSITVALGQTVEDIDVTISAESARPAPRTRIELPLPPFFQPMVQLNGRVVVDESSKGARIPERFTVAVRNQGTRINGLAMPMGSSISTQVRVAPDGTFSVGAPAGESTVTVRGIPDGYSIKSMTSGTTNLLLLPIEIKAGMPEIVIIVTADLQPRFKIRGQIPEGSTGKLLGEQIELVSESGAATRLILDVEGRFLFLRLLPGNYVVRFASSERRITVTDQDLTIEWGAP